MYIQANLNKGKMNGVGIFKFTDGRVYDGEFLNGSRHGKGKVLEVTNVGVYTWPDGRSYDGQWKDGKQHGIGIFVDKNKKKRTAE